MLHLRYDYLFCLQRHGLQLCEPEIELVVLLQQVLQQLVELKRVQSQRLHVLIKFRNGFECLLSHWISHHWLVFNFFRYFSYLLEERDFLDHPFYQFLFALWQSKDILRYQVRIGVVLLEDSQLLRLLVSLRARIDGNHFLMVKVQR